MAQFNLANRTWKSKDAFHKEFLQPLLWAHPVGVPISGDSAEILTALVQMHHRAEELLDPETFSYHTIRLDSYGGKCFCVSRKDGTQNSWSLQKALRGNSDAFRKARIRAAFRRAVNDQIWEVKIQAIEAGKPCALSGEPLDLNPHRIDVHHHQPEFVELLEGFLTLTGTPLLDVEVLDVDQPGFFILKDETLCKNWQDYHRNHAVLSVANKDAHRSVGGSEINPLDDTYLRGSVKRGLARGGSDKTGQDLSTYSVLMDLLGP